MGLRTLILLIHVQSSLYPMTLHRYLEGIQVHILGHAFVGSGAKSIILRYRAELTIRYWR